MSSSNIINSSFECGPVKSRTVLEQEPVEIKMSILREVPNAPIDTVLHRPNWVRFDGVL